VGATATTDRFGKANMAMSFGSGKYITLPSNVNFAFGTGPFTVTLWYKLTSLSTFSILISLGGSNTISGVVSANGAGIKLGYYALGQRISELGTAELNTWGFASLVGNGGANGSRNIKLYDNGVQVGNTYTYNYNFPQQAFVIGANQSSYGEVMYGPIDEVKIYNRALTAADVLALYNNGGPTTIRNAVIRGAVIR